MKEFNFITSTDIKREISMKEFNFITSTDIKRLTLLTVE